MYVSFTRQEMIDRWRLLRHLDPLRADVTVILEGTDTSELDEAEMTAWWLYTVDTAPINQLHATDMADLATLTPVYDKGYAELRMPLAKPLRRIAELRLQGWDAAAQIIDEDNVTAKCQLNPYSRAGCMSPVAVRIDPWNFRLYPCTGTRLESLKAVDENDYTFDERLLSTIGSYEPELTKALKANKSMNYEPSL